jgi:hypothetical protein
MVALYFFASRLNKKDLRSFQHVVRLIEDKLALLMQKRTISKTAKYISSLVEKHIQFQCRIEPFSDITLPN